MATKKKAEEKKAAAAPAKATKNEDKKTFKKNMTDEAKAAKRAAMKERLANRPEGQRPNSKQCDIIEDGGITIKTFAMNVRKFGVVITSVATNTEGEVVSTSVTTLAGVSVKSKKGHGSLVPKVPGLGKKGKGAEAEDIEDEDDDEDEE